MKIEAFDRLYFFIKIIGSDILCFPLPPPEILIITPEDVGCTTFKSLKFQDGNW